MALVRVDSPDVRVFDDLHDSQLAGLLVVFDVIRDLQVQLSTQGVGEVGEELGLENAVQEGIRLLRPNHQREPVVLQVGCADRLDSPDGHRSLRGNLQLVVDDVLRHNVYMPRCLIG